MLGTEDAMMDKKCPLPLMNLWTEKNSRIKLPPFFSYYFPLMHKIDKNAQECGDCWSLRLVL